MSAAADSGLIRAAKPAGGRSEQPAKKGHWQALARQLETRLAMWQRHAASAEAMAHQVGSSEGVPPPLACWRASTALGHASV